MPQVSMDCLGLLFCAGAYSGSTINHTLAQHLRANRRPVAFIDESYELGGRSPFYIVAVAVVEETELHATRHALGSFYDGSALHAAPMFANREVGTLRQATQLVGRQNDGLDVIVCSAIEAGQTRDGVRRRCLAAAVQKVQSDFGSRLFVIDSLGTPTENRLDQHTLGDLRRALRGGVDRDTVAVHCRPSEEILLGLPDVLAWSYRQTLTRGDGSWFEPMRAVTAVTRL